MMRKKKQVGDDINWRKISIAVDKFCRELDKFWAREERKIKLPKVSPMSPVKHGIMEHEVYLQRKLIEQIEEALDGKTKERGELDNTLPTSRERDVGEIG